MFVGLLLFQALLLDVRKVEEEDMIPLPGIKSFNGLLYFIVAILTFRT